MKLFKSHLQILGCLLFEESFEIILQETKHPVAALKDDLRQLLTGGYISGRVEGDAVDGASMPRYDLDRLDQCRFKATRKGLNAWQTDRKQFGL